MGTFGEATRSLSIHPPGAGRYAESLRGRKADRGRRLRRRDRADHDAGKGGEERRHDEHSAKSSRQDPQAEAGIPRRRHYHGGGFLRQRRRRRGADAERNSRSPKARRFPCWPRSAAMRATRRNRTGSRRRRSGAIPSCSTRSVGPRRRRPVRDQRGFRGRGHGRHARSRPAARVNIHGGACALGHPIGATGARASS